MCTNNWPVLLDMSRDDCKRMLRRIELEAYCGVVSAFRAQGDLTKAKHALLQDLQNALSISTERHRAEVRRAVNDEKLTTVADSIAGPDVSCEWLVEGRRLIPLMPRLVPQTAFTVTANNAANMQAEKNLTMPTPSMTANKDNMLAVSSCGATTPSATTPVAKARPSSPASNVVVLPSGMSIHIKGGVSADEEEVVTSTKKRRRSSSSENTMVVTKTATMVSTAATPKVATTTMASSTVSPMKITFTKSPVKGHTTITPSHKLQQKVILVSSSQAGGHNILQRSMPVGRTSTVSAGSVMTASHARSSVMSGTTTLPSNGNLGNIITVAATAPHSSTYASNYVTSTVSAIRPRTKTITTTRARAPQTIGRSGMVIPMGSHTIQGAGSQTVQNIHIKPVSKPTIHIKQEGGMKIITQGVPSGTSKILPKPTGSGSQMVVVTSAPSSFTMVTKQSTGGQMTTGRVLNITTQGGKVIATTRGSSANVVTVNPKTLQLTAIKGAAAAASGGRVVTATGAKPNVIVVQKAQPKRSQTPTTPSIQVKTSAATNSPFEKELVSFIQKQDSLKQVPQKGTMLGGKQVLPKQLADNTRKTPIVVRQRSSESASSASSLDGNRSSLLAELIQAVGIVPDGAGGGGGGDSSATQQEVVLQDGASLVTQEVITHKGPSSNQWVEYDAPSSQHPGVSTVMVSEAASSPAIKALLDINAGQQVKIKSLAQLPSGVQLQQGDVFNIEQTTSSQGEEGEIQYIETSTVEEEIPQEVITSEVEGGAVSVQLSSSADLSQLTSLGGEGLGNLDPQTGIFYSSSGSETRTPNVILTTGTAGRLGRPSVTMVRTQATPSSTVTIQTGKPMDFLSSALSQAQIELDPYQFIEEDEPSIAARMQTSTSIASQEMLTNNVSTTVSQQGPLMSILNPSPGGSNTAASYSVEDISQKSQPKEVVQEEASRTVLVEEAPVITDIMVLQEGEEVIDTAEHQEEPLQQEGEDQIIELQEGEVVMEDTQHIVVSQEAVVTTSALSSHSVPGVVTQEVSSGENVSHIDVSQLQLGDYSSQHEQQVESVESVYYLDAQDSHFVGSPEAASSTESLNDPNTPVRLSKRRRKAPIAADDDPPPLATGGWVRAALGLLHRVSRFRGTKEKGEMNASIWFLQPVDPVEVPDYYDIIKNPMDFSTIKKKLDTGQYMGWEDFHDDMMLVQDNCHIYNPEGNAVRRDCEEVFTFYYQEYEKTVDKWQKGCLFQSHIVSPTSKKPRLDRSPVRP